MRKYRDELKEYSYKVQYFDCSDQQFKESFEQKLSLFVTSKKIQKLMFFEIEDRFFERKILSFCEKNKLETQMITSPMFVTSRESFKCYLKSHKKPFMKTFYEQQRKDLNILLTKNREPIQGQWSFDQENRKKLKKDVNLPKALKVSSDKTLKEVCRQVDKLFSSHPGKSEDFNFPTDRQESLKWLRHFISERLEKFGDYQDAITQKSDFVFHSVLSPMINLGLILPDEIIERVEKSYQDKQVPINSVEGFIRQVIGWREFVRGIYQNFGEQQWSSNFWNHQRKLKDCWYSGETGIPPLDDSIRKVIKTSYNHHIERLMILSNIMLLSEVHPQEVYKWFMEMYADSSDWVMGPNVFGMGQFSDGGLFATKPYTCGSNYYLKMSDYKKGDWCDIVDGLYWRFIDKNVEFYKENPRMSVMVKNLERMSKERRKRIFSAANRFIKKTTQTSSP